MPKIRRSELWELMRPNEVELVRIARKTPKAERTPAMVEVLKAYTRASVRLHRIGKKFDARQNPEYRKWLQDQGLEPEPFDVTIYRRWRRLVGGSTVQCGGDFHSGRNRTPENEVDQ